jgi:hypothetical protein
VNRFETSQTSNIQSEILYGSGGNEKAEGSRGGRENSGSFECWGVYIYENLITLALVMFVRANEAIP